VVHQGRLHAAQASEQPQVTPRDAAARSPDRCAAPARTRGRVGAAVCAAAGARSGRTVNTHGDAHGLAGHSHVFLGAAHGANERRSWAVIVLCAVMMVVEIGGGVAFGSLALVADGLHMSTHVLALLIAALAYTFARRHASDRRFSFGTGKFGDLAGFTSAIVLVLIALLIGYEAVTRLLAPVAIDFGQAIPIAVLGLMVNLASAWLLSGHARDHGSDGPRHEHHRAESHVLATAHGRAVLELVAAGDAPVMRLRFPDLDDGSAARLKSVVDVRRPAQAVDTVELRWRDTYFESVGAIDTPHAFAAQIVLGGVPVGRPVEFGEAGTAPHRHAHRDHNLRAAFLHMAGDAAISVLAILGLSAGRYLGWVRMDAVMGIVGALVITGWARALVRDTGRILLDMTPDAEFAERIRARLECDGDRVADLHLWRLGPGHLGAIVSVVTTAARGAEFYRVRLAGYRSLSHLTVEVLGRPPPPAGG
jgi:cation diffusion facilitator family transporter